MRVDRFRLEKLLGDARLRHAAPVTSLTPIAKGRRLLSSSRDGTARLWDAETGEELRRFSHTDGVWSVQPLPEEREILTAGHDKRVIRWKLDTGEELARYELDHVIFRLAVLPDGKSFVAAMRGGAAVQVDIASGKRLAEFKGHTGEVYGASISPDGSRMVTCSSKREVFIWDLKTEERLHKLRPHKEGVYTVAVSPDGKTLASCGGDKKVVLHDLATTETLWTKTLPDDVRVVSWSSDGRQIAATCDNKTVYLLDPSDGATRMSLKLPFDEAWPAVFSPAGRSVWTSTGAAVFRYDAKTGRRMFPETPDRKLIGSIDGLLVDWPRERFFTRDNGGQVRIWELGERATDTSWKLTGKVSLLRLSPDGKRLLALPGFWQDAENTRIHEALSGRQLVTLRAEENARVGTWLTESHVLTLDKSKRPYALTVWDADGKKLRTLPAEAADVDNLFGGADSRRFFLADDGRLHMWSTDGPRKLGVLAVACPAVPSVPGRRMRQQGPGLSDVWWLRHPAARSATTVAHPDRQHHDVSTCSGASFLCANRSCHDRRERLTFRRSSSRGRLWPPELAVKSCPWSAGLR